MPNDKSKTQILPLNGFFTGYRKTKLKKGQFIYSVKIPLFSINPLNTLNTKYSL